MRAILPKLVLCEHSITDKISFKRSPWYFVALLYRKRPFKKVPPPKSRFFFWKGLKDRSYSRDWRRKSEQVQLQQRIPSATFKSLEHPTLKTRSLNSAHTVKAPTLLTMVTTASKISPLKGLKTTHWYLTGKVTNPVPSLINPFPTFSTPVIATINPCRPL